MNGPVQRIVLTDLRVPFFRLVFFFVKAALAAIPAAIILSLIAFVLSALVYGLMGAGNMSSMMGRWGL
jgi:hypothetical protein